MIDEQTAAGSTLNRCSQGEHHHWVWHSPQNVSQCSLCGYLHAHPRPLRPGVTACIAAHPARFTNGKLARALESVMKQTRQPDAIIVGNDLARAGVAHNRQAILDRVDTEWLAWLDSDDEWFPQHLQRCMEVAEATGSVFVNPGQEEGGGGPGHFGIPFDPAAPYHTTITFLVRTDLAKRVGFGAGMEHQGDAQRYANEDWLHLLGLCKIMVDEGLRGTHLAERTWRYNFDGTNSSGIPGQGDAR